MNSLNTVEQRALTYEDKIGKLQTFNFTIFHNCLIN